MDNIKVAKKLIRLAEELVSYHFRSVHGDPYWITVKYPGVCDKCHKRIEKGERAFYYPKGKVMYGESCGHGGEAEADFVSHAELETFDN